jgi:hypothetical protein
MNAIEEKLKDLGLSGSEIRVYLYLLGAGAGSPPQVAKGTGIARANCYHLLQGLRSKGLISERQRGKRVEYVAKDPEALTRSLAGKVAVAEALLPDLRALYAASTNKPSIHFYEGFDEVKGIYERSLESDFIRAFGSTKALAALDPDFFDHYFKQLKKRGVILRDILTHDSAGKALEEARAILGALYEPVTMPEKHAGLATDMLLWGDNVALITLKEPIFGTVLASAELAKTFSAMHQALFERLSQEY